MELECCNHKCNTPTTACNGVSDSGADSSRRSLCKSEPKKGWPGTTEAGYNATALNICYNKTVPGQFD